MRFGYLVFACLPAVVFASVTEARAARGLDPARLPGIVVDDSAAELSGEWKPSTTVQPYVGAGYQHAPGKSGATARFEFDIPSSGMYFVLAAYTPHGNRAAKAPVVVNGADGEQTVHVNQQKAPSGPLCFHLLGEFRFEEGKGAVVVSTADTQGAVIIDAVLVLNDQQLALLKADAEKLSSALPVKPAERKKPVAPPVKVAGGEKRTEVPPESETPPVFVKAVPGQKLARLTSADLDALLIKNLGNDAANAPIGDEQFLRRASLDIIGRQPTVDELASFSADKSANKRVEAVERLLASTEYGVNWANYWSDVISYRTPQPELTFLNYQPLKKWLAEELNRGQTWDETAFRLITATGKVGENPAATFVGFHQANTSRLATETSRIFLGVNIQCAECHDHKFIDMPRETFHHLAAFFVRTEAKLPWNDSNGIEVKSKAKGEHKMPGGKEEMTAVAFDSQPVELGRPDLTRRAELARWIVGPDNPWFAKAHANRVWARLMGRGFCDPVDDIGEGATPVLGEVYAATAEHFAATGYDTKDFIRLIAGTKAYQRGLANSGSSAERPFAAAVAQKLRGDEVFDSLTAAINLPNVTPPAMKATGAIRFPPPPKNTRALVNEAFGFDPSLAADQIVRNMAQAMFMMNNKQIQAQIDGALGRETMLAKLLSDETDNAAAVKSLFQRVLARVPSERETKISLEHLAGASDRREAFEDLLWGLLNSAEFTTRR